MHEDLFMDRVIRDRRLARADVERLAAAAAPSHLIDCDLDDLRLGELGLNVR